MRACIREAHNSLIKQEVTVTQLCNEALKIIDGTRNLNAFITTCENEAIEQAQSLDSELSSRHANVNKTHLQKPGPLYGIPISIKDNFCTNQILTTCGSKMLHNFVPTYDGTVVAKLKQANAIITGKTNMDEFAMGSSCTTSYYRKAANYHKSSLLNGQKVNDCNDPNRWFMAGGSSTGSAISVASGACFASIGTDTGGSTRQPASLTGVVGFKPTYGLISRFGLIPLAHCLDVVSLLARTVDDISVIFNEVVGMDENDLTSVDHTKVLSQEFTGANLDNCTIRIGIPDEFIAKGELSKSVADRYSQVIDRLTDYKVKGTKFELVRISLAHANLATECYTIISSAEIASNMSCYDGIKYGLSVGLVQSDSKLNRDDVFRANRDAGFGSEVKKRILLGNYFMLEENRERYLVQAQKLRQLISQDFLRTFSDNNVDLILMPSTPTTSISYAEWLNKQDENKLFGEDYFLIPANLANLPSISLPAGKSQAGMPIGLQLIANRFHDIDLLKISKLFEEGILDQL